MSIEEANAKGIYYVPLQIISFDKNYRDVIEITSQDVYANLLKGDMPKTSLPTLNDINSQIDKAKNDGVTDLIVITLSLGLSSTMNAIRLAAEEKGINCHLVDCYTTCQVEKYLALKAKEMIDLNYDLDKILAILNKHIKTADSLLIPNNLNHLKRGGRITPAAAALAGVLGIKPILRLHYTLNGKIDNIAKIRTKTKAYNYIVDKAIEETKDGDYQFMIIDANNKEDNKKIVDMLKEKRPNIDIYSEDISSVIACHTGLDSVCIQLIEKINL